MNLDNMIQGNPQALVTSYNGVLVADSLEVADRFGKAHKNVVRDIENLMDGIEANRLNFEPIAEKEYFIPDFYTDKRNREQKRYKLTRDGFSLLVMGFTGPAALHWKLLYIEAFNKMEEALKMQKANEQLIADAAELILKKVMPEIVKAVGSATAEMKKQIPKQEAEESPEGREINGRRMYSMYGNKEALPNLLTVYDVRDFLGIGQRQAYELVRSEGFPAKKLGNQYFIPKDGFLKWLDGGFI